MNERPGMIRDKLDIKILLLYILQQLPYPVKPTLLSELVFFDGGFSWFDYTDCLAQLTESGQVTEEDGRYAITDRGRENIGFIGTSIPYSVRAKADRLTAPVAAQMRRDRQIEAASEEREDGSVSVSLRLSDGVGEVIALRLSVPDAGTAAAIEARFRKDAEKLYNKIIELILEE